MKKPALLLALILLTTLTFSQQKVDNGNIIVGKIDSLQSRILGEQRKIWIHVPGGDNSGLYSPERYAVVYVLDGDAHFKSVVGMIEQLSSVNGNTITPKMIVVGIPNTDRTRDLTPSKVAAEPPFIDSAFAKTSGGGAQFISFIEKELMPYVESKYPTAPYKMLIGHSFGGLAVMNILTNHANLFNSYICIDPSMWWDNQKLLKQTQKVLAERKFTGKSLYLGIANTLEDGVDIKNVEKDTSEGSIHIRSIFELRSSIEKNKQNGLKFASKYYPDDTHGSAPFITEYDALRFFFDFYPLKLTTKDYVDRTGAMADKYEQHFAQVSKKMGYKIKPDEAEMNALGYEALGSNYFINAERFFKLNIKNYPESFNVYDSYADYFIAIKDKANAIIQLKKALSIKENKESRQKLEELQGAKN